MVRTVRRIARPSPAIPGARRRPGIRLTLLLLAVAAVAGSAAGPAGSASAQTPKSEEAAPGVETAIFAGGCFWCVESDFDHVPGVMKTTSGYSGGHVANPTYEQVGHGDTGHREAVKITFDPRVVSYATLLDVFWHSVDPTDAGGQFCDRGHSYTTAVYAISPAQLAAAEASRAALGKSGALDRPVVTEVAMAGPFWPAEDYHQDYYEKNPVHYKFYRWSCGRDAALDALWGKDAHRDIGKE